ncbi:MAG: ATP-binding protein [candidate division Zixibacteria bacterium]|nr:ATP-binding protein [candidate division Zixibacteria bacterium]
MDNPVITGNKITIPPNLEYLADVDSFVEGLLRGFEAEESIVADVAISVSELVNNAVIHGQKAAPDEAVVVEVECNNGEVKITVSDCGGGFDPDQLADPLADENLMKEVGRGLFIVKSLMDKVDINVSGNGTTVAITKTIK